MNLNDKIYIAGHNGMVGSSILRRLKLEGYTNIVVRSSKELNLIDQKLVADFFNEEQPEYVFLSAAKVGGILANNTFRADFIYENLMIQNNIIHQSYLNNVKKLMFFGSSCIYPKLAPQPLKEDYLLTGELEETNEPYAIAKIAGIKMCDAYRDQYNCNFISVMPTNLYGPQDNYDLNSSHVLPAMLRKFITAKNNNEDSVTIWGTGLPKREFLHVDDLAEAAIYLMKTFNQKGPINIGVGIDISIKELAEMISSIVGYNGEIKLDGSKPDGTPRKLMNISKLKNTGWVAKINLEEGIKKVFYEIEYNEWK